MDVFRTLSQELVSLQCGCVQNFVTGGGKFALWMVQNFITGVGKFAVRMCSELYHRRW